MKCYMPLVTATAIGEIGYTEKKSFKDIFNKLLNSGDKNYTKYAWYFDNEYTDFYNGKKNGYSWCDVFVDWCFVKAYGVQNALRLLCQPTKSAGAGCTYSMRYYIKEQRFFAKPKIGDQIFFGKQGGNTSTHTGLVVKVDNKKVYTVEGNKSNKVKECSYQLTDNSIIGYGRPDYDKLPEVTELKVLRKVSAGTQVKLLQSALITLGYSCGECAVDGCFGNDTLKAVKAFQKAVKIEVDGIVGPITWSEILKRL